MDGIKIPRSKASGPQTAACCCISGVRRASWRRSIQNPKPRWRCAASLVPFLQLCLAFTSVRFSRECAAAGSRHHPAVRCHTLSHPWHGLCAERCPHDRYPSGNQPAPTSATGRSSAPWWIISGNRMAGHGTRCRGISACPSPSDRSAARSQGRMVAFSARPMTPFGQSSVRKAHAPPCAMRGRPTFSRAVIADPYLGILPTDRFESIDCDDSVSGERLRGRGALLDELEASRSPRSRHSHRTAFDRHR